MQDYASRLTAMAPPASSTLGPGSAQALTGGYSNLLPGAGQPQANGNGSGFRLDLAGNAPVSDEQRSIIETMLAAMNNAPRVR